jgi:hypothetical protein
MARSSRQEVCRIADALSRSSVYALSQVVRAIAEPLSRQGEAKTLGRDGLLSQPIKRDRRLSLGSRAHRKRERGSRGLGLQHRACAKASRPDEGSAMPPDADDDLASDRALADAIIRDALRRDADRVVAVVAEVIERLKAKRGYSAQQLDAAARALLDELSAESTEVVDKRLRGFDGGR